MTRLVLIALGSALLAAAPIAATAAQINTGGATGAYHRTFCPSLTKQLDLVGRPSECKVSDGTPENLRRIARNPDELGFGQLDVFALEAPKHGGTRAFEVIRSDDVRECVFAVTRNRNYTNYGEIAVNADRIRFVLPPKASGSAKTFEYLAKIDPEGLGRARNIVNATDTDEAIRSALEDENSVTFFVQFPDPANPRFQEIRKLNGHLVPVVDSIILDQKIDDRPIYFAQETLISQLKWLNLGRQVVTACTPLVLFTGATERLTGQAARAAHRQLVLTVRALERKELVPPASPIAEIVEKTRQLSTRARYHFQELSLNARERARPMMDRIYRGAGYWVNVMILKARPPEYRDNRDERERFN